MSAIVDDFSFSTKKKLLSTFFEYLRVNVASISSCDVSGGGGGDLMFPKFDADWMECSYFEQFVVMTPH